MLQHLLQVVRNLEVSLSLATNLVYRDAVGKLDKGEAGGKVNIEDTLDLFVNKVPCPYNYGWSYQLRDNSTNAFPTRQRENALLQYLWSSLFVGVLHCHHNFRGCGIRDKIHCASEASHFTW